MLRQIDAEVLGQHGLNVNVDCVKFTPKLFQKSEVFVLRLDVAWNSLQKQSELFVLCLPTSPCPRLWVLSLCVHDARNPLVQTSWSSLGLAICTRLLDSLTLPWTLFALRFCIHAGLTLCGAALWIRPRILRLLGAVGCSGALDGSSWR